MPQTLPWKWHPRLLTQGEEQSQQEQMAEEQHYVKGGEKEAQGEAAGEILKETELSGGWKHQ